MRQILSILTKLPEASTNDSALTTSDGQLTAVVSQLTELKQQDKIVVPKQSTQLQTQGLNHIHQLSKKVDSSAELGSCDQLLNAAYKPENLVLPAINNANLLLVASYLFLSKKRLVCIYECEQSVYNVCLHLF